MLFVRQDGVVVVQQTHAKLRNMAFSLLPQLETSHPQFLGQRQSFPFL